MNLRNTNARGAGTSLHLVRNGYATGRIGLMLPRDSAGMRSGRPSPGNGVRGNDIRQSRMPAMLYW